MREEKKHVPGRLSGNMISRGVWGKPCSWKAFWEHAFAGCLGGPLGASQGVPSGPVGCPGGLWRSSQGFLGASGWPPGAAWGLRAWVVAQRPLECLLGPRGTPLGGFWAAVLKPRGEPFWGLLGSFWGLLRASLGPLGGLLGSLGALLGPPWALSGRKITYLDFWSPSWAPLGALSGPCWALLGASWVVLEPSRAVLGPS